MSHEWMKRVWEGVTAKLLHISPKFSLFWGRTHVTHRETGTFLSVFTPGFDPVLLQNKGNFDDMRGSFAVTPPHTLFIHATYAPNVTFIMWFIARQVRFYPFYLRFWPSTPTKQGEFEWYMKGCHWHTIPFTYETYAPNIIFIMWFIVRRARFYPFGPPVLPQHASKTRGNLGDMWGSVTVTPSHALFIYSCDMCPK